MDFANTNNKCINDRALIQIFIGLIAIISITTGCSSLPRNALPLEKADIAQPLGVPDVRAAAGVISPHLQSDMAASIGQEPEGLFIDKQGRRVYNALALSGGGANGAFGAGFLYGWSEKGARPEFKLITGISTGSLIAPFAFLGQEYDEVLKQLYTSVTTEDIVEQHGFIKAMRGEAFTSSTPLAKLIKHYFDDAFLQAVARAHDQGRRLYIGTVNMDSQRFIVWNMGLIAKSDSPYAMELFHKVVLASTSIPAAFPPVFIDVEADGEAYDEMHVDGGTRTQVFFYAGTLDLQQAARSVGLQDQSAHIGNLYIIRNGHLDPEPEITERKLADISGRAVDTMIKAAAMSDLYRIYAFTRRENIGFHYVAIPQGLEVESEEPFDPVAMKKLFEAGYQLGLSAQPWQTSPPGLANETGNTQETALP